MVGFMPSRFSEALTRLGLYCAVYNVKYRIKQSNFYIFSILDLYNSGTCAFITSIGELDFDPHDMLEVSALYEWGTLRGVCPSSEELHLLKAHNEQAFNT